MPVPLNASSLLLVAANLLPIVGVVFWGWDAFVLLMLYWLETAIIGFWTIVRVIAVNAAGDGEPGGGGRTGRIARAFGLALFFTVHAGIFMTVHFVFLWTLFSGTWASQIHGPVDFFRVMIVGTDLWIPLIVLFVVRGAAVIGPGLRRRVGFAPPAPQEPVTVHLIVIGLYLRIVAMQVAIILGAWVAMLIGSIGPLILLVILKTGFDLFFDPIAAHVEGSIRKAEEEKGKLGI